VNLPWEISDEYIRSGHRSPEEFQPDSLRTITLSEEEGIKAVIGKPKGKETMEVQSYLFDRSKGWNLDKAKTWFSQHHKDDKRREHFFALMPFKVLEKIVEKPLHIRGVALTSGMSRNLNIYMPEELQVFAQKLVSAPVYIEHVAVPNAVGKVVKTEWDGKSLWYEAEIYDDETAEKIRKGLIRHVSIGADYETIDILDGKVPHGLHNAELSLVAVPGFQEANIQILERVQNPRLAEQHFEPIVAGEYILGFYQDASAFLPEHYSTVWLDRENGILAITGKLRANPEVSRVQSIFFSKERMWDENKIRDWLLLHPHYTTPASASEASWPSLKEGEEKRIVAESFVKNGGAVVPVEDVVKMIQKVLPSPMVERSWGLGPQRLCQELRGLIFSLRRKVNQNASNKSFQSPKATWGVSQAELAETKSEIGE
jgi:hypothetical protein